MSKLEDIREQALKDAEKVYIQYDSPTALDRFKTNWNGFSLEKQGVLTGVFIAAIIMIVTGLLK